MPRKKKIKKPEDRAILRLSIITRKSRMHRLLRRPEQGGEERRKKRSSVHGNARMAAFLPCGN